jgi:glutathione S-transferase
LAGNYYIDEEGATRERIKRNEKKKKRVAAKLARHLSASERLVEAAEVLVGDSPPVLASTLSIFVSIISD